MSDFRRLLADALLATEVLSPTSFSWFGVRAPGLPVGAEQRIDPEAARSFLLDRLQARLYADFYCSGGARPELHGGEISAYSTSGSSFLSALSSANKTRMSREAGWTVVAEEDDKLVLRHGGWGLKLWAGAEDTYPPQDAAHQPGTPVALLMPKELLRLSPGYYMALGEAEFPADGSSPLLRHYWNLRSDGAAALIAALTGSLNRERLPFRVKVVSEPGRYSRCDAGVLYTLQDDHRRVRMVLEGVYPSLARGLKSSVPALTKPLRPGLAVAEDPGAGAVSFGTSRTRMLAEAILEAAERSLLDLSARLDVVEARFARAGISIDAPYLNPGSRDRYQHSSS